MAATGSGRTLLTAPGKKPAPPAAWRPEECAFPELFLLFTLRRKKLHANLACNSSA